MQALVLSVLGCLLILSHAMAYSDENKQILTLRAVSEPSAKITRLIDELAEPISVQIEPGATLRQVITRQCGSVSTEYVKLLNSSTDGGLIDIDKPLEKSTLKLPACLYYSKSLEVPYITVHRGDTAYALYRMKTGGGGTEAELVKYFDEPLEELNNLKIGSRLQAPAVSLPVVLSARPGKEERFREIHQFDPQGLEVRKFSGVDGDIVMGIPPGETAAGGDCETPSEPVNAEAIYEAYMFSKGVAQSDDVNVAGGRAKLAIVDNGFFGAQVSVSTSKAFEGSPFRRRFFKADPEFIIAQRLSRGIDLQPINYSYDLQPTLESGHGTHVAGIALGGPELEPYLDKMGQDPWASVAIINVGRGAHNLVKGAHELLLSQLQDDSLYRIVNLSIIHDGSVDRSIRDNYKNLFGLARNTLFVVAAGNNGGVDVEEKNIMPAALGGAGYQNVITVAAIDGSRRIAKFSNVGNAVDMAAPGCGIRSWIANSPDTVIMSGTSQATPAVTNEALLQLSLAINTKAATLKNRTIASGDLLPESERGKTFYEVSANPARSLFMFHDYLEIEDGGARRDLLGTVVNMPNVTCVINNRKVLKKSKDMFSLKRVEGKSYFFGGMVIGNIQAPCLLSDFGSDFLYFSATHELLPTGKVSKLPRPVEQMWPLRSIINLVVHTPLAEVL